MQGHAVVILDAVQAHPGHGVVASHVVGVVRLVLVPEKSQRDFSHESAVRTIARIPRRCGPRTNLAACRYARAAAIFPGGCDRVPERGPAPSASRPACTGW